MNKRATAGKPGRGVVTLLVVAVMVVVTWWVGCQYFKAGAPGVATTQSAELLTADRMILGGEPRAVRAEAAYEVLTNKQYVVGYSEKRKDPVWVAYRLIHVEVPFHLDRPKGNFLTDMRTSARVTHHDYSGSAGYDRGHMAPNSAIAKCFGAEAQHETFFMSNICPQAANLNQKVWEKLEVEELADAEKYGEVWVMDGPVFEDLNGGTTDTLRSGVAVPSSFYKILVRLESGRLVVFAVIMPQTVRGNELPRQFAVSVSEVEKEAGLEFFWKLGEESRSA